MGRRGLCERFPFKVYPQAHTLPLPQDPEVAIVSLGSGQSNLLPLTPTSEEREIAPGLERFVITYD